jgi:hypothetical protein
MLAYWDEDASQWQDAATTCVPSSLYIMPYGYERSLDANRLSVAIYLPPFTVRPVR